MRRILVSCFALVAVLAATAPASAAETLSPGQRAKIDASVGDLLATSGAPSASIAVVRDGAIVYTQAYGSARLDPKVPASPAMRYSIGSISKQFTSSMLLLLAEQGKLTLDDKLVRWFPDLTRADEVTVRELLSMTSGYQDFWPQDYVMPNMLKPVTPGAILAEWGGKPLDFDPGTRWQYSNTNYVIAGELVQKLAGKSVWELLREKVFGPLGMTSVYNTDEAALPESDATRYLRYALGPPRPAPKEGPGWMFAAGELAMTAHDLALWDVSMIDQKILSPASYHDLETDVRLKDGRATGYGLGITVTTRNGRRLLTHGGEVSGFTARNDVYPDAKLAVVCQVNLDATSAATLIARKIGDLLLQSTDEAALAEVKSIYDGLRQGNLDRTLFSPNANAYLTPQAIADFKSSLHPLGKPTSFEQTDQYDRGGMTCRKYSVKAGTKNLRLTTFTWPDGKLEQYQIAAEE